MDKQQMKLAQCIRADGDEWHLQFKQHNGSPTLAPCKMIRLPDEKLVEFRAAGGDRRNWFPLHNDGRGNLNVGPVSFKRVIFPS